MFEKNILLTIKDAGKEFRNLKKNFKDKFEKYNIEIIS